MATTTAPTDEQQIAAVKAAARKILELSRGHYWRDPKQQARRESAARSIVIDTIGADSHHAKILTDKARAVAAGYSVEVAGVDVGPFDIEGDDGPTACPQCGSIVCEGPAYCDPEIEPGEDARVGSIEDLDPMAVER